MSPQVGDVLVDVEEGVGFASSELDDAPETEVVPIRRKEWRVGEIHPTAYQ